LARPTRSAIALAILTGLGAASAVADSIRVSGQVACPSPAAVEARLKQLAPEQGLGDTVVLEVDHEQLRVQLRASDGAPLGQRTIPLSGACSDRVEVAAVVLATWLSTLAPQSGEAQRIPAAPAPLPAIALPAQSSEVASAQVPEIAPAPLPAVTPPARSTAATAASSSPSGEVDHAAQRIAVGGSSSATLLSAARPPATLSAVAIPSAATTAATTDVPAPNASTQPIHLELAGVATGSFTSGGAAPGARLLLAASPDDARWAIELSALFDGPRTLPVPPGEVRWQRWGGALGAKVALFDAPAKLELGADFLMTALHASGQGFSNDAAQTAFDPAAELSARLLFFSGPWRPWLGLWTTAWLRQETPVVEQLSSSVVLPRIELFAGVGLSWKIN